MNKSSGAIRWSGAIPASERAETTAARTQPAGTHPALAGYVALVIALGAAIIIHSAYRLPSAPQPGGWALLGVLAVVAASFALKVPGVPVYLSISDAFFMTSALLFGPAPATLTIAIDSLVISIWRRNNLQQRLFNATSSAAALWAGVQAYGLIAPRGPLVDSSAAARWTSHRRVDWPRGRLLRAEFRIHRGRRRTVQAEIALADVAAALRDHLAQLFRGCVGVVLPGAARALGRPGLDCGRRPADPDLPPRHALVARTRG